MCNHQLSLTGLTGLDRRWLPSMLSNLEFLVPSWSSYMRTHHSFWLFKNVTMAPQCLGCIILIFVKVDDFWHQCQWNVVLFIRFMASVMPDAINLPLTGARINLTLLHLCSCFSGYPLRGENLGVWVLKQLLVSFYFWFLKGEGNRLWHAPVTAVLVPLVRLLQARTVLWAWNPLRIRSIWCDLTAFVEWFCGNCFCSFNPVFIISAFSFSPDPGLTPHLSDTQKVRMQVSRM